MNRHLLAALILGFALSASYAKAPPTQPSPEAIKADIDRRIAELAGDEARAREAQEVLSGYGEAALPALRSAVKGKDPVARRYPSRRSPSRAMGWSRMWRPAGRQAFSST